jgi:hypothetical protein
MCAAVVDESLGLIPLKEVVNDQGDPMDLVTKWQKWEVAHTLSLSLSLCV